MRLSEILYKELYPEKSFSHYFLFMSAMGGNRIVLHNPFIDIQPENPNDIAEREACKLLQETIIRKS